MSSREAMLEKIGKGIDEERRLEWNRRIPVGRSMIGCLTVNFAEFVKHPNSDNFALLEDAMLKYQDQVMN